MEKAILAIALSLSICTTGEVFKVKGDIRNALTSKPDIIVFVPPHKTGPEAENQHFLVVPTPSGSFLAFWTQATRENHPDQRVVVSRSVDGGLSWSDPVVLAGDPQGKTGARASWGFPFVVPHTGRVYIFWNQNIGVRDVREDTTGVLTFRFSDDDGLSWSETHTLPIRKGAISNPDPKAPENWIVYQIPIITPRGDVLVGFTRWASRTVQPEGEVFDRDSEIWFLRFDNILTESDPTRLRVTTLPRGEHGIRVPHPTKPHISAAQEPSIQPLSDSRLICVMRTLQGCIYFSTSDDGGESWSEAKPLRFCPGGPPIPQPIAPCPLYKLRDGRFLLVFHNNDGTANGGSGPMDYKRNRRPAYLLIGREIPDNPEQPLIFGTPKLLADNGGVPDGAIGRTEIATYTSLFEFRGKVYFWYPDRKHYLLGKILTPNLLDDSGLPR